MSFDTVCSSCGAPSGPSVGVCPFCKSVLSKGTKGSPSSARLKEFYSAGKLENALVLARAIEKEKPKVAEKTGFLMTYVKILLEAEGPSSKIKQLATKAHLMEPENSEVNEYIELIDAKYQLFHGGDAEGKRGLHELLRRSPKNVHALFLIGSHSFWYEKEPGIALRYLERCVSLRPKFLRAWGCLGAVYSKLNHPSLAVRAFRKCFALENNPQMREFFKDQIEALTLAAAA